MKDNIVKFELSPEKLLDLAEKKLDEGDFIAALRFLRKSRDMFGAGVDEAGDLAEAYEGLELYEYAADCWFEFLDVCSSDEKQDAYEGLAACFYNLGNENAAMYYYNKVLKTLGADAANRLSITELFGEEGANQIKKERFRIVWPPERVDYSDEIDEGLRALRSGDPASAEKSFLSVSEDSDYYVSAQNYLAVAYLLGGENGKAEKVCCGLLKNNGNDVQALSTYAAVLAEQERKQEGRQVAEKLASIDSDSPDELYKIATVCCENGLYEQAYEKFCKLESFVRYDRTMLFFKAVAALRAGKTKESLQTLGKIIDVYPQSEIARYYYVQIREYAEKGGEPPLVSFFYRLPAAERERRIQFLKMLHGMNRSELCAYCNNADITDLLLWCFDEIDGAESQLQILAVEVAIRADLTDFVADILLKTTVNDLIKLEAVLRLCDRNRDFECGIVISDVYKKIVFEKIRVGAVKRKKFVRAYAVCYSRFALFGAGKAEDFRAAAENVYRILEQKGALDLADGVNDLVAVFYLIAAPSAQKETAEAVLQRLKPDISVVEKILGCLNELLPEDEAAVTDSDFADGGSTEENKDEID